MIQRFKDLALYFVVGLVLVGVSKVLESNFLTTFFGNQLLQLLVALLAINVTSGSVIVTKLLEIQRSKNDRKDFVVTAKELKASLYEQVFMVAVALLIQVIQGSSRIAAFTKDNQFWLETILATALACSILNVVDTGKAAYILLETEGN